MKYHKLKLMPEFECWPVWFGGEYMIEGCVDPAILPLSNKLVEDLNDWTDWWDRQYNRQDPLSSGFKDTGEAARFNARGREVLEQLKLEMPDTEWTLRLPQQSGLRTG
ncbi:MAG TPA: hypothetical protein DDZ43_03000 [Hyphomonadaceae bacterium]|nr:hypothetical protein [Hyphomonadaceae bacterium]